MNEITAAQGPNIQPNGDLKHDHYTDRRAFLGQLIQHAQEAAQAILTLDHADGAAKTAQNILRRLDVQSRWLEHLPQVGTPDLITEIDNMSGLLEEPLTVLIGLYVEWRKAAVDKLRAGTGNAAEIRTVDTHLSQLADVAVEYDLPEFCDGHGKAILDTAGYFTKRLTLSDVAERCRKLQECLATAEHAARGAKNRGPTVDYMASFGDLIEAATERHRQLNEIRESTNAIIARPDEYDDGYVVKLEMRTRAIVRDLTSIWLEFLARDRHNDEHGQYLNYPIESSERSLEDLAKLCERWHWPDPTNENESQEYPEWSSDVAVGPDSETGQS